MRQKEIIKIMAAEAAYWNKSDKDMGIGASAAIGNILSAMLTGRRAPWHPKAVKTKRTHDKRSN